jgi:hypothetical protein
MLCKHANNELRYLNRGTVLFGLLLTLDQTFVGLTQMVGNLQGFALVFKTISMDGEELFVSDDVTPLGQRGIHQHGNNDNTDNNVSNGNNDNNVEQCCEDRNVPITASASRQYYESVPWSRKPPSCCKPRTS